MTSYKNDLHNITEEDTINESGDTLDLEIQRGFAHLEHALAKGLEQDIKTAKKARKIRKCVLVLMIQLLLISFVLLNCYLFGNQSKDPANGYVIIAKVIALSVMPLMFLGVIAKLLSHDHKILDEHELSLLNSLPIIKIGKSLTDQV